MSGRGYQHYVCSGNVVADPKIYPTKDESGDVVAAFSVAVNRQWTDGQGNKQEAVEYIPMRAFGGLAKIVEQFVRKGKQVMADGEIRNTKYTDKDGIERYSYEIHVNELLLGPDAGAPQQ